MSKLTYGVMPLNMSHVRELAPKLRRQDVQECVDADRTPSQALVDAISQGHSFAALLYRNDQWDTIGAYGINDAAVVRGMPIIWSLWSDISLPVAREILHRTPYEVKHLLGLTGAKKAGNLVWNENFPAIRWLALSGCFRFDDTVTATMNGNKYTWFETDV